jgi:hypothetical protein
MLLHDGHQFPTSLNFLLIDHPTLLIPPPQHRNLITIFRPLKLHLLSTFLLFNLPINHRHSTQNKLVDSFLLLTIKLPHLIDFEFKQSQRILNVLNMPKLRTLHFGRI